MILTTKKCEFFTDKVEYLGHIIRSRKFKIDNAHTASLKYALPPTNESELRYFLELCNVYRRFVDNFVQKAVLLHILLQKITPENFTLKGEQTQAF